MKKYIANIIITANSKELKFILEKISELCEEKDCVQSYSIVSNINKKEAVK